MHVQKCGELSVCFGDSDTTPLGAAARGGGREKPVCALPPAPLAVGCCLFTVPGLGFRSRSSFQLTVSHRHAASRPEDQGAPPTANPVKERENFNLF